MELEFDRTNSRPDCSRHLRELTRDCHERVESIFSLDELVSSPRNYATTLQKWAAIIQFLEEPILRDDLLPDGEARRKLPLLCADLHDLNDSDAIQTRVFGDPFVGKSQEYRLGGAYVLEGSTLGGKIIAKRVAKDLGFTDRFGARFFNCYGKQVGPMWRSFLDVLNRACDEPSKQAAAVDGARYVFNFVENNFLDR